MKSGDFAAGVLIGAALGAAFALIYAPASGEETREQVVEKARKFKDAATERGRAALHRVKSEACEPCEESAPAEES
jgi:gas vesicle protein